MEDFDEFDHRTVEETFKNYSGRRSGIIKALTIDLNKFRKRCDSFHNRIPDNEYPGLYAFPCGKWDILLSADVPKDFPHSILYKLPREEKDKDVWLRQVATHCDTWLFSVAFFFCGYYTYKEDRREHLFGMMNELPTMYELVTGNDENQEVATKKAKKRVKDKSTVPDHSSKKSKSNSKVQGMSSSRLVSTRKVLNSAKVTSDTGYKPIKDFKREGKKAITKRELPMPSAVVTRSKALGIQTRA